MNPWIIYAKERFPLGVYLIMVSGFVASGMMLWESPGRWMPAAAAFVGVMGFFALLRLMDEVKDYATDQIAHPERPLPRGILDVNQVRRVIKRGALAMVGFSGLVAWLFNWQAGLCYLLITGHLWLMYREFYVSEWLEERMLLYAASHQAILIWVCAFCVLIGDGTAWSRPETWVFGILVLGSFFTYEVCRKLDPKAHQLLRTYRSLYGTWRTGLLATTASGLAVLAAWYLGLLLILLPLSLVVIASYFIWVAKRYKVVEGIATLSLTIHLWILPIKEIVEWFS